jgi:hypothetical protein
MPTARKWLPPLALRACLTATLGACSVANPDHCSNREGSATCRERGLGDYCSLCIAANDGCVDQAPADDCLHTSSDPQTTTAPTTTAPTTSTSGTSTTGPATSTTSTTGSPSSTSSTTTDTGDTTATTGTPMCGDNTRDPGETCDGTDLDDQTCNKVNPQWGGGTLLCGRDCMAFDQSMCCLNIGQTCAPTGMTPNEMCCNGSTCELLMCTN